MGNKERRAPYVGLCIIALAFGWIEAAAVVYLREIHLREANLARFQFPLIALPADLVSVEIVREACTLLVLGAVAWLAGRRLADRMGAFLLVFGVWDLTYYGALRLVRGWPESLTTWDLLFLIPLPWVAPVWAPATVAGMFVVAGTYLFWTAERPRQYRRADVAIVLTSALVIVASFLVEWRVVLDREVPQRFPLWLFWTGVVLGTLWFVHVERRSAAAASGRPRCVGVRVRQALPEPPLASPSPGALIGSRAIPTADREVTVDQIAADHAAARRRLDALMKQADEIGERLERLGHGLSAHPTRMIIGLPDRFLEQPSECEVVPGHALPPIERLIALTNDIREAAQNADELGERLILMGRADLIEEPDVFFK